MLIVAQPVVRFPFLQRGDEPFDQPAAFRQQQQGRQQLHNLAGTLVEQADGVSVVVVLHREHALRLLQRTRALAFHQLQRVVEPVVGPRVPLQGLRGTQRLRGNLGRRDFVQCRRIEIERGQQLLLELLLQPGILSFDCSIGQARHLPRGSKLRHCTVVPPVRQLPLRTARFPKNGRARAIEQQRLEQVRADEIRRLDPASTGQPRLEAAATPCAPVVALHRIQCHGCVEHVLHEPLVLVHAVEIDFRHEPVALVDGLGVLQNDRGILFSLRLQGHADDTHEAVLGGMLAVAFARRVGHEREIFEQLGAHEIALTARAGCSFHRPDARSRDQNLADSPRGLITVAREVNLGVIVGLDIGRRHRRQHELGVLQPILAKRILDNALQLLRAARFHTGHVRQRRADGVGAEQAGHEHQRVHADGQRQRKVREAVAVQECVPGHDETVRLVVPVHLDRRQARTDGGRVLAGQPRVLNALATEGEQRIGRRVLRQLLALGAVGLEGDQPRIEGKHTGCRLRRLLGIAVDGARHVLGGLRARHGIRQIGALLLQHGQPFRVWMLVERGARALESRQNARRVELGPFFT